MMVADKTKTQAFYFSQMNPRPSEQLLQDAGAKFDGYWWVFPDASKGRFMPFEGRFAMPSED